MLLDVRFPKSQISPLRIQVSSKFRWTEKLSPCYIRFGTLAFALGSAMCISLHMCNKSLDSLLSSNTPVEEIRESLPLIAKFLAEAAAGSVKSIARTFARVNSARRAIWLKSWKADMPITSKNKLCAIPFKGKLLFGSTLEIVLMHSADKSTFLEKCNKFR